jgi:hypothetical protein
VVGDACGKRKTPPLSVLFPMFVPSLSWQIDQFSCTKWLQKGRFPHPASRRGESCKCCAPAEMSFCFNVSYACPEPVLVNVRVSA